MRLLSFKNFKNSFYRSVVLFRTLYWPAAKFICFLFCLRVCYLYSVCVFAFYILFVCLLSIFCLCVCYLYSVCVFSIYILFLVCYLYSVSCFAGFPPPTRKGPLPYIWSQLVYQMPVLLVPSCLLLSSFWRATAEKSEWCTAFHTRANQRRHQTKNHMEITIIILCTQPSLVNPYPVLSTKHCWWAQCGFVSTYCMYTKLVVFALENRFQRARSTKIIQKFKIKFSPPAPAWCYREKCAQLFGF